MADSLADIFSGSVQVKLNYLQTDTQEIGYATNKKNATTSYSLTDGSAAGQSEAVYAATRSIPANSIDEVDLLALQQDALGASLVFSFARIRVLRVVNKSPESGSYIYFGASETNPMGSFAMAVAAGSEALLVNHLDGYEVVQGNNILRTYNPNSTTIDYELYVIGAPA